MSTLNYFWVGFGAIPAVILVVYVLFRVASAAWYRSKFEWGFKNQNQETPNGEE